MHDATIRDLFRKAIGLMTDVLFTHSYFLRFDPKEEAAMMPYPPLGTLYAAAAARRHGYSVALFDTMLAAREDDILLSLRTHRPRILVIYDDDFNYLTKMCLSRMREAAFRLSALGKESGCTIIAHGSDPVDHIGDYLDHQTDYVICGEGEQTLVELLGALLRGAGSPADIDGLAFRHEGALVQTPPRKVLRDLDALPFPARDLLDVELYRRTWRDRHGFFSVNMVTTRGCPFHCNWCAKPLYGQVYNCRTPENVVVEMKSVKQTLHPDHLWFCDDIFGLKPGWVPAFADLVRKEDALIPFKCLARADLLLKENTIDHLRRAGCETVWIGAESGSQKILDAMEKGTTVQQISEASQKLRAAGIRVGFFLQYGYPGETRDDIELTLNMVKTCRPDDIGISVSYPLPGTPFYESVLRDLGEKRNWVDSRDLDLMFRGTYVPDFYRALHRVTHKRLRLWQGFDAARSIAIRPWETNMQSLRRIAASGYHLLTLPALEARMNALARQRA
jgi:anaerobic magnesium-protoporphyrin IX monomethyl ester cyclase